MAEKKYIIDNPTLMAEWDWEKNNELGLDPESLTFGSGKKVFWRCEKGHGWQAAPNKRTVNKKQGCPYCSHRRILIGFNDLATLNPKLANEWNYEKNADLRPEDFMPNSNKKAWWKCDKGHEWFSLISHRNKGVGCPYCSGRYAIKGETDLQTVNPKIVSEWNHEKNGDLQPEDFVAGSNRKIWWRCKKGHEWQAMIVDRHNGQGCPICHSERNTSFPEYAIVYYLDKCRIQAVHRHKGNGYELDIYIPSKKIAIEYDGYFWHKDKIKKDLEKNLKCKSDGIKLYRLREGLSALNDYSIDYIVDRNQKDLAEVIQKILSEIIGFAIDINLKRDTIAIENLKEYTEKSNSLLALNLNLAKEWNYKRNGNLRPEHFTVSSGKKVWWKCDRNHEWQAIIADRNNGNGCPYCSGQKVFKGFKDLATINPKLANEWNYKKNDDLKPEDFNANSGKKVWWRCKKGHEWQAIIASRNKGVGCPYCSGKKVLKGFNDLATINPKLANEWNYKKNDSLKPEDFNANSSKKVWWRCAKGHEWQATISNRNYGYGCPYCSGRYAILGENDLQSVNPALAKEWNYEKNGDLSPNHILPNSDKKVWWKCKKGHEWQARIQSRNNGCGCPYCSGRKKI